MNQTNNSFSMHIEEEDDIKEQNKLFPEINDNRSKLLKSEEKSKENNNNSFIILEYIILHINSVSL